ncbi:hypothetical protein FGO68_gene5642 [Halteria grandinella]|uniref:Uncharacterized protein n=1 Tax=Halteria grandinella TaxID=5974 RepID=A0A8J8NPY3_HALGN|nr:hypothetical protein FGO68_gene5642 [Halteria grandinella]
MTEKASHWAKQATLPIEVDNESMKISKKAYGGVVQCFLMENPEFRLQFSNRRISFIKYIPLLVNTMLRHKYVFSGSTRTRVSFTCSISKCKAHINIYVTSSKNVEECRYEFISMDKHSKECERSDQDLAPYEHHLDIEEQTTQKVHLKPSRKDSMEKNPQTILSEQDFEEKSDKTKNGVSADDETQDYIGELEKIIDQFKVMTMHRAESE